MGNGPSHRIANQQQVALEEDSSINNLSPEQLVPPLMTSVIAIVKVTESTCASKSSRHDSLHLCLTSQTICCEKMDFSTFCYITEQDMT